MATADEFRRIALSLEGAEEGAHQKHPDFRFAGQVFATLGYPDAGHGMVKLEPMMQEMVIEAEPDVFRPAPAPGAGRARPWWIWRPPTAPCCAACSPPPGSAWAGRKPHAFCAWAAASRVDQRTRLAATS